MSPRVIPLLAVVFVIRYFAIGGGPLLSAQVSYGWEADACAAKKVEVDAQPDPKGLATKVDCINEPDLGAFLYRGDA